MKRITVYTLLVYLHTCLVHFLVFHTSVNGNLFGRLDSLVRLFDLSLMLSLSEARQMLIFNVIVKIINISLAKVSKKVDKF